MGKERVVGRDGRVEPARAAAADACCTRLLQLNELQPHSCHQPTTACRFVVELADRHDYFFYLYLVYVGLQGALAGLAATHAPRPGRDGAELLEGGGYAPLGGYEEEGGVDAGEALVCPEDRAGVLSRLTFSWMNPLMRQVGADGGALAPEDRAVALACLPPAVFAISTPLVAAPPLALARAGLQRAAAAVQHLAPAQGRQARAPGLALPIALGQGARYKRAIPGECA